MKRCQYSIGFSPGVLLAGWIVLISVFPLKAQDIAVKARISLEYHKIMMGDRFLQASVKFKGDEGYQPAVGLQLKVYHDAGEDSMIFLGQMTTNAEGMARWIFEKELPYSDSITSYSYVVKIEDSRQFKDAKKSIRFMDSNLEAEIIKSDSVAHLLIRVTDAGGRALAGQKVKVMVQRLFAPLAFGKAKYKTDANGEILIAIENPPPPGVNGKLPFEILMENRKYGIVKRVVESDVGTLVSDQSDFDKRSMWAPPSKVPLFLLIVPNLVLLGIWITIAYLLLNLYKIYKS